MNPSYTTTLSYADHCLGRLKKALEENRFDDAAFYAEAISREYALFSMMLKAERSDSPRA